MKKYIRYPFIFFVLLISSCKSKQETVAAEKPQPLAPVWVNNRPNNGFKFIGIGFADKSKGGNYQMEAKKNALYDLSSEIKVDISVNSVLYTVQNNNNFNENFNSLIKLSNSDNIEGYTLVDSYENDKQYWVYYQLDRQEYAKQKAAKKQQTILKAANLISASFTDEKNKDFSSSLKKRIQAFGVLAPYLGEEIVFDPLTAGGLKTVIDLTSLIQQQLQSIKVVTGNALPELKPFQPQYLPITYQLQITDKAPLQNFPFVMESDEEKVRINDRTASNAQGEIQVKVNTVETVNQIVSFAMSPDIITLMGSDSVGRAGVSLLKQFIQTNALKVQANVSHINLYISSVENNLGFPTGQGIIEQAIKQKFGGQEMTLTSNKNDADFIIESVAETSEDNNSNILERNYNLHLAALNIQIQLKAKGSDNVLYKTQVNEVYGYANSLDQAGLNAYSSPKLSPKLSEALFFLKRKIVVY